MSDQIDIKIRTKAVLYGDDRTFIEYKIQFWHREELVGLESGPHRQNEGRPAALKSARARVAVLRRHRLYAVRVTRKHISDGQARDCNSCAIAQALWHNQERMGLPKREWDFEVSPYGWGNARGIVLGRRHESYPENIPADGLPKIVFRGTDYRGRPDLHGTSMVEWAMGWDDWAESRQMSLSEWRKEHASEPDERPWRPSPSAFVLDLDAFKPMLPL
jgi:hypothetical protein